LFFRVNEESLLSE